MEFRNLYDVEIPQIIRFKKKYEHLRIKIITKCAYQSISYGASSLEYSENHLHLQ